MKYLVDTSVWSLALRRKNLSKANPTIKTLEALLTQGKRVFLTGMIIQETLQGIKNKKNFHQLKEHLNYFPILEPTINDYVYAAELFNLCRSHGVQASTVDFMICSLAIRNQCKLFTTDKDFHHIAKWTKLELLPIL